MPSIKASVEGLSLIKQAIAQKGWRVRDDRWLVAASYLLEPSGDWRADGPYAYGCSLQTWERFLQGVAIRDRSFLAFCQVLDLPSSQVLDAATSSLKQLTEQQSPLLKLGKITLPSNQELLNRIVSLEHRMQNLEDRLNESQN
ncbi:MAG: hypothetical protein ACFB16_12870 [Phormidesmis sp.]